ncbi:hypothetical protein LEP1GSC040_0391 [Leptospira santarosai str. 2000030832]|nr:hypothetical protein LEP1GSC040_0391 [Leptospira santarosai str. 2000030832]
MEWIFGSFIFEITSNDVDIFDCDDRPEFVTEQERFYKDWISG